METGEYSEEGFLPTAGEPAWEEYRHEIRGRGSGPKIKKGNIKEEPT